MVSWLVSNHLATSEEKCSLLFSDELAFVLGCLLPTFLFQLSFEILWLLENKRVEFLNARGTSLSMSELQTQDKHRIRLAIMAALWMTETLLFTFVWNQLQLAHFLNGKQPTLTGFYVCFLVVSILINLIGLAYAAKRFKERLFPSEQRSTTQRQY